MADMIRVMIVEDLPTDAELNEREVRSVLPKSEFLRVETREDFLEALESFKPDIILSDYKLPHFDGMAALLLARERAPEVPFIIITGSMNEDTAVECMKAGAWDYVIKEHVKRLGTAVLSGLKQKRLREERKKAEKALRESESKFRAVFEIARNAIGVSKNGVHVFANPAYLKMLGYESNGALAGTSILDSIAPSHRQEMSQNVRRRSDGEQVPFAYETRGRKTDGTEFDMDVNISTYDLHGETYTLAHIQDITERKRMEEKIKAVALEWTESFDAINEMITIHDADFNIIRANKAAESTLGLSLNEILSRKCFKSYHGTDRPPEGCPSCQTLKTGIPSTFEVFEPHLNKFIEVKAMPRFDTNHKIIGVVHVVQDISERKHAEATLKASEERYRSLVENANDAVFTVSPVGIFTSLNAAFERITGRSVHEWIGRSFRPLVHPDDLPRAMEALLTVLAGRSVSAYELRISHATGEIRYIELAHSPQWQNGRVVAALGIGRDITERKQSEHLLDEYQDRIKLLLDSVAEGIYGIDHAGNCTFCNMAAVRLLGYQDANEMIGKNMHGLIHHTKADGSFYPREECIAEKAIHSGESYHSDREPVWRRDGSSFLAEYWAHPILKDNVVQGMVVSFVDRTEYLSLENQLRHAQKMEAIGVLAGGIAHDFNNILSAIIGYGHITLMKMLKDDPLRLNVEHMMESADRAAALTQSLLTFSHKQITERKPVDLNTILKKVEKFLIRVIGEDIAVHLTMAERELTILADSGQLEQVFMNLATNARDEMSRGGSFLIETTCVELDKGFVSAHGYGQPGTYAMISVTDTGVGMNEETRKKIFEPFFTTKEIGKGTGLGLAMVYGILKQNDAFINVYSEPGAGTTFRIYFPLIKAAAEEGRKAVEAPYPKGGPETILYAEDDPNLRNLSVIVLEQMGYTMITAGDGEEAVQKFMENKDRIQLLLLDIMMPKKSGRAAAEEIRKVMPRVPVLFVSGYSPDMLREKSEIDEGQVLISKPMSPKALLKKVREVLDRIH